MIVNWMNGKCMINNKKFRMMVQKTQNTLDKTDIRLMGDHSDMFQHIYRDWNQEADRLTHVARGKGATWNFYIAEAGTRMRQLGVSLMAVSAVLVLTDQKQSGINTCDSNCGKLRKTHTR